MFENLGVLGQAMILIAADHSQLDADLGKIKDRLERQIDGIGKGLKTVGKGLTASLTVPIVGVATASAKMFVDFDTMMKKMESNLQPSREELEKLEQAAMDFGRSTAFNATEVASALNELGKAGFDTNKALGALPAVLDLATVAEMGLAESVEVTADILHQFNLKVEDASKVNDALVEAARKSTINVEQMVQSFKYAGPVAAGFGNTIQETAASIAALGNVGIKADMAGTTLRNVMTRIENPTKMVRDALKDLGIETLKSADGTIKLADVIDKLREKGASTGQMMQIFGQRAGPGMVALVAQGSKSLRDLELQIEKAEGAAKRAADKMNEGLGGQFKKMWSSIQTAGIAIGSLMAPTIEAAIVPIRGIANYITDTAVPAFEKLPKGLQIAAGGFIGLAAAIGPATYALGLIVGAIPSTIQRFTDASSAVYLLSQKYTGLAAAARLAGIAMGLAAATYVAWEAIKNVPEDPNVSDDIRFSGINPKTGAYGPGSRRAKPREMPESQWIQNPNRKGDIALGEDPWAKAREEFEKLKKMMGELNDETDDYVGTLGKVDAEYRKLTPQQKAQIVAGKQLGKSVEELAEKFDVQEATINKVIKSSKAYNKELEEQNKRIQGIMDQFSGADTFRAANDLIMVLDKIGGAQKLTADESEQMFKAFDEAMNKMVAVGRAKGPEFERLMKAWIDTMDLMKVQKHIDITDFVKFTPVNPIKLQESLFGPMKLAPKVPIEDMIQFRPIDVTKMATDIGIDPDESFVDLFFRGMGTSMGGAEGGKQLSAALMNVVQSGNFNARNIGSTIGSVLGTWAGAALGTAIMTSAGIGAGSWAGGLIGSVAGPLGGIAGAALGAWIGDQFGKGEREAQEAQSMRNSIIQNAGGLDQMRAMLPLTEGFDWEHELDILLNSEKPKEVAAAWRAMREELERVREEFKNIDIATSGVNTRAEGLQQTFQKVIDDQMKPIQAAHEEKLRMMREEGRTSEEIEAEKVRFAEETKNRTFAGTAEMHEAWSNMLLYVGATIQETVKRSGDLVAAVLAVEPAMKFITDAQKNFGIEASEAGQQVLDLYKTVSDNKDVFQSVAGLGGIMQGLGGLIKNNVTLANAFGHDLANHFKELTDRGVDAKMAMALMAPQIQILWEAQEKYGLEVDDTTQALIDQAKEQGIVGEHMRDVNLRILDVLERIAKALGADIPAAVDDAQDAFDGLTPPDIPDMDFTIRARWDVPNMPESVNDPFYPGERPPSTRSEPEGISLAEGGFANWGSRGTRAVLHNEEAVMSIPQLMEAIERGAPTMDLEDLTARIGTMIASRPSVTLAPVFQGTLANDMTSFLRDQWLPMTIQVLRDVGALREDFSSTITS